MMAEDKRVVALIDMDCFYVQVEERANPENKGKPGCVVQYKNWKGGGIIAVNYEARAKGVTRSMRGDEARERCPECILYRVPELRGKADLTKYRDAGKEVIDVLWSFGVCIERASIDEAYLDMTSVVSEMLSNLEGTTINPEELPNTHIVGLPSQEGDERGVNRWLESLTQNEYKETDWKLSLAAVLCEKMRAAVYEKTGFRCSAGIASNKMLAKLACGINKPNKQTVMPMEAVGEFFKTFPLKKVRNLGGKLGLTLNEDLNCTTMGDVADLPERVLQQHFEPKTANWLYWYARGVDLEPVSSRRLPKSIGCNKNFTGSAALDTRDKILHWLEELCSEVTERLDKDRETNQRQAKLLSLSVRLDGDIRPSSYSRSLPLSASYDKSRMARDCLSIMIRENPCKQPNVWNPVVTSIGVSASKFVELNAKATRIDSFFTKRTEDPPIDRPSPDEEFVEEESDGNEDLERHFPVSEVEEDSQEAPPSVVNEEIEEPPKVTEAPKKPGGFFASRAMQKKKEAVEEEPAPSTSGNSTAAVAPSSIVNELFPDLDQVDMDTLALLPPDLQREVRQALSARGTAAKDASGLVACDICGKSLLKEEVDEHKDYHVALKLQKEMSGSAQASSTSSGVTAGIKGKSISGGAKTTKRTKSQSSKKSAGNSDSKRTRTIETFFRNPT